LNATVGAKIGITLQAIMLSHPPQSSKAQSTLAQETATSTHSTQQTARNFGIFQQGKAWIIARCGRRRSLHGFRRIQRRKHLRHKRNQRRSNLELYTKRFVVSSPCLVNGVLYIGSYNDNCVYAFVLHLHHLTPAHYNWGCYCFSLLFWHFFSFFLEEVEN